MRRTIFLPIKSIVKRPMFYAKITLNLDKPSNLYYNYNSLSRCGGIGRHKGLKIPRSKIRTGSSPVSGTSITSNSFKIGFGVIFCFGKIHCKIHVKFLNGEENILTDEKIMGKISI